ncbi:MAG: hypothetical protein QOE93_2228 [Actinomycetota bacterium]|jgi:hypothetical protein|nr:hypothetical protein [Actinomycetota bacterium]
MVRTRYLLAVASTLALALAGCGGGDDEVPTVAEDTARAERIIFNEDDFPGYTLDADDEDDEDDPFRECLGGNQVLIDLGDGPRSAEADFSKDDGNITRSSAAILTVSEDEAEEAFAVLTESDFADCFKDAIQAGLDDAVGDDADVNDVTVSKLPDEDLGEETVGYRGQATLEDATESIDLSFDYVFFRVDRGLAVLFTFDVDDELSGGERTRLAKVLVQRLEDEV